MFANYTLLVGIPWLITASLAYKSWICIRILFASKFAERSLNWVTWIDHINISEYLSEVGTIFIRLSRNRVGRNGFIYYIWKLQLVVACTSWFLKWFYFASNTQVSPNSVKASLQTTLTWPGYNFVTTSLFESIQVQMATLGTHLSAWITLQ